MVIRSPMDRGVGIFPDTSATPPRGAARMPRSTWPVASVTCWVDLLRRIVDGLRPSGSGGGSGSAWAARREAAAAARMRVAARRQRLAPAGTRGCHCWLVQQCPSAGNRRGLWLTIRRYPAKFLPRSGEHCWTGQQWHPTSVRSLRGRFATVSAVTRSNSSVVSS